VGVDLKSGINIDITKKYHVKTLAMGGQALSMAGEEGR
jgi:hypothetical protein